MSLQTEADDAADHGPKIKVLCRYSDLCGAKGVCICETDAVSAIGAWGCNWAPMAEIAVPPVLTAPAARAILSSKPMYQKK